MRRIVRLRLTATHRSTGFSLPTLARTDATLDYALAGDGGPLVVQLHGLTSSRARDVELGLDLSGGLSGVRVLRYDARGHGRSTGPADPGAYTWPRLADDLLALLDAVAPGEVVHGVGPSMGSATLLLAALREPERFASLTLVSPPTAWATRVAQRAAYAHKAELVEIEGVDALIDLDLNAPVVPVHADAPPTHPDVPGELLPAALRGAAASDLPSPEELARITAPTLVLAWTDDPTHPLSTAQVLVETIAGAELVVAATGDDVARWPARFAAHVAAHARAPHSANG